MLSKSASSLGVYARVTDIEVRVGGGVYLVAVLAVLAADVETPARGMVAEDVDGVVDAAVADAGMVCEAPPVLLLIVVAASGNSGCLSVIAIALCWRAVQKGTVESIILRVVGLVVN
ncbi:hypothetical protein VE00_09015 [Pseudogymnoascus sp. WSF 3629]|nr:hypothetical protein VE00_09015 [Pseudogymnoascus sp. WSF 3629]